MNAWDVVEHKDDMNVINETWTIKYKQFLNDTVKEFKACFCGCGDLQLEGVEYFEICATVVRWITVCLMLILENILGLKPKQSNVTAVFLHAALGENEKV
ncbi:hypothetical protein ACHAXS_001598 [Conticribra weissflogii]